MEEFIGTGAFGSTGRTSVARGSLPWTGVDDLHSEIPAECIKSETDRDCTEDRPAVGSVQSARSAQRRPSHTLAHGSATARFMPSTGNALVRPRNVHRRRRRTRLVEMPAVATLPRELPRCGKVLFGSSSGSTTATAAYPCHAAPASSIGCMQWFREQAGAPNILPASPPPGRRTDGSMSPHSRRASHCRGRMAHPSTQQWRLVQSAEAELEHVIERTRAL